MLLCLIFLFSINTVTGLLNFQNHYFPNNHVDSIRRSVKIPLQGDSEEIAKVKKLDLGEKCESLSNTRNSPFIVFVLRKTSGHYLGIGAIIDRKTVLTAERVITVDTDHPQHLKVLGGCLSPWWAKNSQVRTVSEIIHNENELVLLIVKNQWNFNNNIFPVKLQKDKFKFSSYGVHIAGILVGSEHRMGDPVIKKTSYYWTKEYSTTVEACLVAFPHVGEYVNVTTHYCLDPVKENCEGVLGSPVMYQTETNNLYMIGLIVRTRCEQEMKVHLVVLIENILHWIQSHSIMGFNLIK